jgi:hypothetical protein
MNFQPLKVIVLGTLIGLGIAIICLAIGAIIGRVFRTHFVARLVAAIIASVMLMFLSEILGGYKPWRVWEYSTYHIAEVLGIYTLFIVGPTMVGAIIAGEWKKRDR